MSLVHIYEGRHWNPNFLKVCGLLTWTSEMPVIHPQLHLHTHRFQMQVLSLNPFLFYRAVWMESFIFPSLHIVCGPVPDLLHTYQVYIEYRSWNFSWLFFITNPYCSPESYMCYESIFRLVLSSKNAFWSICITPALFCRLEPAAQGNIHRFV